MQVMFSLFGIIHLIGSTLALRLLQLQQLGASPAQLNRATTSLLVGA